MKKKLLTIFSLVLALSLTVIFTGEMRQAFAYPQEEADFPEIDCGSVEGLMSFATERNKQRVEAVKSRGLSREAAVSAGL